MSILKSRFTPEVAQKNFDLPENSCFHQLFERQAAAQPDHVAIICREKKLTYGELNNRANQLAWHLRSRGIVPETLIPICVDRSIEMAVGILGILKSGAAYVPIDPAYPAERIEFMLADTSRSVYRDASGSFAIVGKRKNSARRRLRNYRAAA